MRTYKLFVLFVCLVTAYGNSIGGSVKELITCSKFDFEEKLLEKVIRNELTMAQWEKRIEEKLKQADDVIKKKITEFEVNVSEKLKLLDKSLQEDLPLELKRHRSDVDSLIVNFKDTSKDMFSIFMDKHNETLTEFESNALSMKAQFDENYKKNQIVLDALVGRIKNETENQQQMAAGVLTDLKLNSSILAEKLTEQQQKMNRTLTSYVDDIASGQNRGTITACVGGKGKYKYNRPIIFPNIKTKRGISNTVTANLANNGTFICEKTGLYLISVFITSNKDGGYICLRKNRINIAIIIFSVTSLYQTNSATVIYNLHVNDEITVEPCNGDQYIRSDQYSCMVIVQLSE